MKIIYTFFPESTAIIMCYGGFPDLLQLSILPILLGRLVTSEIYLEPIRSLQ